jgi:hypothetical protein
MALAHSKARAQADNFQRIIQAEKRMRAATIRFSVLRSNPLKAENAAEQLHSKFNHRRLSARTPHSTILQSSHSPIL